VLSAQAWCRLNEPWRAFCPVVACDNRLMTALLILALVCALTYGIEIVYGLAGTILMLPVMGFWFPEKTLVIYSVMPQILVATIGLMYSPRVVDLRYLAGMVLVATAGLLFGMWTFFLLDDAIYRRLMALMFLATGAWLLRAPHGFRLRPAMARTLDLLGGVSQGLFGISGPIMMTRLLGSFDTKTVVRNYALAFFLVMNLARTTGYVARDSIGREVLLMMAVTAPALIGAAFVGNRLHHRVSEKGFRRVVAWLIVVGGVVMLLR
jgi:uncharacterized membrane protein YfcA